MIKLATYILLDIAGIACLTVAFMLGGPGETTFIALIGGAGVACAGMGALLIREEIRGRYRERAASAIVSRTQAAGSFR